MRNKYPTSFQTTDCIIFKTKNKKSYLLLGKKQKGNWRFIGGFVDPLKDKSLEEANVRERKEEAGKNLKCYPPYYLFSFQVDDPRYRDKKDKIMTAVFLSIYISGKAIAGDDIKKVKWFELQDFKKNYKKYIVKEHFPIVKKFLKID